jgi:hypothetical protein
MVRTRSILVDGDAVRLGASDATDRIYGLARRYTLYGGEASLYALPGYGSGGQLKEFCLKSEYQADPSNIAMWP